MDLVKYYFVILFIISFTSLNLCQQCLKSCKDSSKFEKVIRIAILLPSEKSENQEQNSCDFHPTSLQYHNKLEQVQPGIEVISDSSYYGKNQLNSIFPGWTIEVLTGDTQCSSAIGPLEAVRLQCQAGHLAFEKRKPKVARYIRYKDV